MIRWVLRLAVALVLPLRIVAQSTPGSAITIGRIDTVWSATLKEKRPYLVYTPPSYADTTYTPRTYPVLYLLDGDAHFHSVTGLIQALATGINGSRVIPEMIVVAIPNTNRMRDLSPTNTTVDHNGKPSSSYAGGGGLSDFLRFMQTELIPRVDSAYRTSPYRMLVGHSLGGIAAIDALYTMPATFNSYVAIDPSLWWDKRLLLTQAKPYFSQKQPPGRALYVALANTLGADDSLPNGHYASIVQFNRIVEAYNASGIRYGFNYYAGDDHGSVPLIAEYDALRFIFAGYKLDMQQAMSRPASVTAHYAQVSTMLGYRVLPPEGIVDQLGSMAAADTSTAVEFRRLNTELYPSSGRAWAALGSMLLARRDTAGAIVAFERSTAVRPAHRGTLETLRKLKGGK